MLSAPLSVSAQSTAVPATPLSPPPTSPPAALTALPVPTDLQLIDKPNDDGSTLLVLFHLPEADGGLRINAELRDTAEPGDTWHEALLRARRLDLLLTVADMPECFGWGVTRPNAQGPYPADAYVFEVDRISTPGDDGELASEKLNARTTYAVRLVLQDDNARQAFAAGEAKPYESWFNGASANILIFSVLFAMIIMGFIFAARRNPNLFIRRISGLEAVDEAIGRATEMGKPVLHINGLDPLSTLATLAAVNILGRIAKRVANYESTLLVPCFDPVVMTVSQEVVRSAYLEAGRPDAYREDNIYFLTDQQFSYVASVCGLMLREKPAANFLLGYFYAESLILAETGAATGAIQIAGTDALSQLPFFITTCDYTLIGEELYAASAYLSREPMLLGSLKGQDVGKAFVMVIIVLGTILATIGAYSAGQNMTGINWEWITQMLTPLA